MMPTNHNNQTHSARLASKTEPTKALRRLHPDRWLLPFALGVGLASVAAVIAVMNASTTAGKLVPLGSSLKTNFGHVTVRSVRYDAPLQPGLLLPPTMQTATLDIEINNTGDKPVSFLPAIHTYLRDDQGGEWKITPTQVSYPFPAGDIPAGRAIRGELSYLVPKKVSSLWWYAERLTYAMPSIVFEIVPATK